jgi:hypothetical protein
MSITSERNARLIFIAGGNEGMELPLTDQPVLIGRGPSSDILLQDGYASRAHCWIEPHGDTWWLRDLGSKNGTLIGTSRVQGQQPLRDGDVIVIGATQIRFSDPAETHTYSAPIAIRRRLMIDIPARDVLIDGTRLDPPLSPKQWALMETLWQRRGDVVSKDDIASAVWPEADGVIYDYQIDKLVSRLRARLGEMGDLLVETIWGFGYKLH